MLVAYTNTSKFEETIGTATVKPGQTRRVDARLVPAPAKVNATLEVLYFNILDTPKYFAEHTISPGAWLRISANFVVNPNGSADEAQTDILKGLLTQSIPYISDRFEPMDGEELAVLLMLEKQQTKPRSSLVTAIKTEIDDRAKPSNDDLSDYKAALAKTSDAELELEALSVEGDADKLALIEAERQSRKQKSE
jgi:hypothetical protein